MRMRRENAQLRSGNTGEGEFTGVSSAINQVRATIKRVAGTGSRMPITGPAGSGKEVAARLLHAWRASRAPPALLVLPRTARGWREAGVTRAAR